MIKLSNRLDSIKKMIPPQTVVADIGADHGYLICSLIQDKIINQGYAVENKKGPYNHLCSTIAEYGLENQITPYLGDGILPLPNEVNLLILAGMGSENIVSILKKRPDYLSHIDYVVADSHTNLEYLRREISLLGYQIINEDIVLEKDIFYEIILFKKGQEELTDLEYRYGPILLKTKSSTFKKKYLQILDKNNNLLSKNLSTKRYEEITKQNIEIKDILK